MTFKLKVVFEFIISFVVGDCCPAKPAAQTLLGLLSDIF
jgi:hypothetical protein